MAEDRITLNRARAAQLWRMEAARCRALASEARSLDESRALRLLAQEAANTAERFESPSRSTVRVRWL